jgi:glutathione synthase/RimK-type ligase-like ATP-grasp enzyme
MSKPINKIKQYEIFKNNNIATPLTSMYDPNMDFSIFNGYVVLKPYKYSLQSVKENIFVFPIEQVAYETPYYDTPYIIQQFIDSGEYPSIYRAVVFLGEVLYLCKISGTVKKVDGIIPIDFNNKNSPPEIDTHEWDHNQLVYDFAKIISNAFPDSPLLGVDIIEDTNTGKLYAIEVNAGGNVWHFSKHSRYPHLAEKRLNQYGAFDVAADALIKAARKFVL